MTFDENMRFAIVDVDGKIVNLRELTHDQLIEIQNYLRKKFERAKSDLSKFAYSLALDRLKQFQETGNVGSGPDPFTMCTYLGMDSLTEFVERYMPLDIMQRIVKERSKRRSKFEHYEIPDKKAIVSFYLAVCKEKDLQKAVDLLSSFFGIGKVLVKTSTEESDVPSSHLIGLYEPEAETIYLKEKEMRSDIERIGHLCHEFFHHLAFEKSWYFHDDPRINKDMEQAKANQFMYDMLETMCDMKLLKRLKQKRKRACA